MTGLDQDMMQKNLSCRNLQEAQKNMYCYGFSFIPLNFLFLCLGILLIALAGQMHLELPAMNDDILPMFAAQGYLGDVYKRQVQNCFTIFARTGPLQITGVSSVGSRRLMDITLIPFFVIIG